MAEHCFIIGIDFGTTYSGIYWCWSGQPDQIQLVTRWKTRTNLTHDNAKVPTEIHYSPSGTTWGYDIPEDQEPIRWFKLLLVSESDLEPDLRNSAQIKRAKELVDGLRNKTTVNVIADYLRLLWGHAIGDIIRDRGEAAFKGCPLKVWITVPAIWQSDARERMRQAVRQAGILDDRPAGKTTLDLVAEPEAAAMAVLDDFKGRPDVEPGDVFVVCDAGGGTVDLISYTVDKIKPLVVRECVEGKGKMCGAIFVDAEFERMLRTVLGEKWKRISATGRKRLLTNDWEFGIKRTFDDSNNTWTVSVPVEAFEKHGIKGAFSRDQYRFKISQNQVPMQANQLKFGRGHIREWFQPCIQSIRALIHEQVKAVKEKCDGKSPKAILLVGGLGACQYLYSELHKEFDRKGIMVLQPGGPRPWTAICRGAVIRGLNDAEIKSQRESLVVSRVSRVNYGMVYMALFNEDKHDERDRVWEEDELCWRANNQMHWYLKKGDDVYAKHPVQFRYFRLFANEYDLNGAPFNVYIYRNGEVHAPTRRTEEVKSLVKFLVDLDVGYDELSVYRNPDGKVFRRLNYEIQMISTGTEMTWKFLVNGDVQGEQNVRIFEQEDDFRTH